MPAPGAGAFWDWLYAKDSDGSMRQVMSVPRFSDLVLQELDCGNCVLGGGDPVRCIADHRADWRRILPALAADGVKWFVVKPVAHPDSLADLEASIKYLRNVFCELPHKYEKL